MINDRAVKQDTAQKGIQKLEEQKVPFCFEVKGSDRVQEIHPLTSKIKNEYDLIVDGHHFIVLSESFLVPDTGPKSSSKEKYGPDGMRIRPGFTISLKNGEYIQGQSKTPDKLKMLKSLVYTDGLNTPGIRLNAHGKEFWGDVLPIFKYCRSYKRKIFFKVVTEDYDYDKKYEAPKHPFHQLLSIDVEPSKELAVKDKRDELARKIALKSLTRHMFFPHEKGVSFIEDIRPSGKPPILYYDLPGKLLKNEKGLLEYELDDNGRKKTVVIKKEKGRILFELRTSHRTEQYYVK